MYAAKGRALSKVALGVALVAFVAACGDEGPDDGGAPAAAAESPRGVASAAVDRADKQPRRSHDRARAQQGRKSRPSIRILAPPGGEAVHGGTVTVSVAVDNFQLVRQRVRPPFPKPVRGKGHVHFYLDTERLPARHGPPATGVYRSTAGASYTWTGIGPGRHSLAVQLVGRDHAPLRPPAQNRVTVVVE